MWTRLAQIALGFIVLSLPLLNKKETDYSRKTAGEILDDAIAKAEEEDFKDYDKDHFDNGSFDSDSHTQLHKARSEVLMRDAPRSPQEKKSRSSLNDKEVDFEKDEERSQIALKR